MLNMYKKKISRISLQQSSPIGKNLNQKQVMRRASVKTTSADILGDIGDAFADGFDLKSDDVDEAEGVDGEDSESSPDLNENNNGSDWREVVDPQGRTYYYNKKTLESSWTKPAAETNSGEVWDETQDPTTGKKYFVERQSRRTSWVIPGSGAPPTDKSPAKEAQERLLKQLAALEEEVEVQEDDSAGATSDNAEGGEWSKTTDSQGRTYYYERAGQRRSSWVLPKGGSLLDS